MVFNKKMRISVIALFVGVGAVSVWRVGMHPIRVKKTESILILGSRNVEKEEKQRITQTIVSKAIESLGDRLDPHMLEILESDMSITVETVLEGHDGVDYLNYFKAKGILANESLVTGRTELYRTGPYKQVPDEEWDSMTETERYALIIGSSSMRGAGWKSFGSRSIRSGLSEHHWPDPPEGMKSAVAFSAFEHPADVIPSLIAWVEVSVEFHDQNKCIVRLMFRWDKQADTWVPYIGAVYTPSGIMPLHLL